MLVDKHTANPTETIPNAVFFNFAIAFPFMSYKALRLYYYNVRFREVQYYYTDS